MNGTNVTSTVLNSALERLSQEWDTLTPEAQKAAHYVLENPYEVGISTVREIARAAKVKPNTLVRMARQAGFAGFDDFRTPFREAIRSGKTSFPERARWLQDMRKQGGLGELYADMVSAALNNLEQTFARIPETELKAAAELIWVSRNVFTLGVGVNHANAHNFTYLASTGMVRFHTIPNNGSVAVDDLAWADERDVLIAMTMKPYRVEVVETVKVAKAQKLTIIGISDSPASPIIRAADRGFIVATDTPQFFPSSVATIALLEMLLSFVIASASDEIIERIEKFHQRRYQFGIYQEEPS